MEKDKTSIETKEAKRERILRLARERVQFVFGEEDAETFFPKGSVGRAVDAALSYTESEDFFYVKNLGSIKKGEGRRLLARFAHKAFSEGKFIALKANQ